MNALKYLFCFIEVAKFSSYLNVKEVAFLSLFAIKVAEVGSIRNAKK